MSLVSFEFILFLIIGCIIFYILPKKIQWICLLALSMFFYLMGGWKTVGFILFTALTTWGGALLIQRVSEDTKKKISNSGAEITREQKKLIKAQAKRKKQVYFWGTLVINFGILAYLKYINFILENINAAFSLAEDSLIKGIPDLILPLGISFYTFQSMGYLIDVYWGKAEADKNPFKFLLFVSFFPQVLQGPIGRHGQLAAQLYQGHKFDLTRFERGLLLMMWGYFKKLAIANRTALIVNSIFDTPTEYGGAMALLGAFFFALQQYADFSGGIDVVTGAAELFDIHLMENFRRPYFSRSLSEFWRRWHISLGAWMRDYVFYPFAVTKAMGKFGSFVKKHMGKTMGKVAPVAIGNILVFLLVGIWHGPYWHYVFWGLYNGVIIAVSAMLEPVFTQMKEKFHINVKAKWYIGFSIIRTFMIVTFGGFFDRSEKIGSAFYMLKQVFSRFQFGEINMGTIMAFGLSKQDYIVLALAFVVLLGVEIYQEIKGASIRDAVFKRSLPLRWGILYAFLLFAIAAIASASATAGEFMYAQF